MNEWFEAKQLQHFINAGRPLHRRFWMDLEGR